MRRLTALFAAGGFMVIASPASGQAPTPARDQPDSTERKAISDRIGADLKDPYSAQFTFDLWGSKRLTPDGLERVVCGTVNAKNSFGAYVGKRQYWVLTWRSGETVKADLGKVSSSEDENVFVIADCALEIGKRKKAP